MISTNRHKNHTSLPRRKFIKQSVSAVAAAGISSTLLGASSCFAATNYDWKLGWQSVEQDSFAPIKMKVEGNLPHGLNGNYLRNGPAKLQRDDVRYQHWFDGDGMVQKFSIQDGDITHSGQYVHTFKYKQEEKAQRFLYNGTGTVIENALPGRNNDTINTANTALQMWDGELLALWEGGSAYRLDAENLQTKGIKTWHDELANMPFSAHPLIDQNGNMWNCGFAPYAGKSGKVIVYYIEPKKGLQKSQVIDLPFRGFMHDFAQTEKSLVFVVPPYTFTNAKGKTFVDKFQWQPQLGARLLVVDKDDLNQQQWFELPAGFVFHFGHATEENGNLQVNMCWYDNANLMQQGMSELMRSGNQINADRAFAATVVANMHTGQAKLVKSQTTLEFPGFDDRSVMQNSTIYGVSHSQQALEHADTLMAFTPYDGEVDSYRYPKGVMVEEPILVTAQQIAGANKTHAGYILQTFLDVGPHKKSGVNVFEANNLQAGPIAQASMERTLPLGFHGTYVAA
jgi:all-trans-8'-apo-beta-carotenal 15,15'-oxygenase